MSIKKPYVELVEFLEANKEKKVSTLIDSIYEMCESKKSSSTVMKDSDGNVIAIFCYYHKQWELLSEVEYGSKVNTQSGFNTMCKVGVSKWTKAQRDAKSAKEDLLNKVASGEVEPQDIAKLQEDIEETRTTIDTTDMPNGYASESELMEVIS